MGFYLHKTDDNRVPGFEDLPCSYDNVKIGTAVILSLGTVIPATGTTKPSYIVVSVPNKGHVQAIRVLPDMVFETISSESMTSVSSGDKVTLSADGEKVTATTTSGIAELVYKSTDDAGGMVRVRFC